MGAATEPLAARIPAAAPMRWRGTRSAMSGIASTLLAAFADAREQEHDHTLPHIRDD